MHKCALPPAHMLMHKLLSSRSVHKNLGKRACLQRVQEPVALQDGHSRSPAGGHHVGIPSGGVIQVCEDRKRVGTPPCILCSWHSRVSLASASVLQCGALSVKHAQKTLNYLEGHRACWDLQQSMDSSPKLIQILRPGTACRTLLQSSHASPFCMLPHAPRCLSFELVLLKNPRGHARGEMHIHTASSVTWAASAPTSSGEDDGDGFTTSKTITGLPVRSLISCRGEAHQTQSFPSSTMRLTIVNRRTGTPSLRLSCK